LRIAGETRREDVRHSTQMIIVNSLMDIYGNPSSQQFKGQLEDISLGGLSLMIRISKKENARLLLGRGIISFLPVGPNEVRERRGEIVGVSLQDYVDKDYRIHVRFYDPMGAADLKTILQ